MTLILSGTDGLSDVDGSAATPAIRGTDANTGIFFPAADQVAITTGGTQRAVVDASGNMGLGVTPSAFGSGSYKALQIGGSLSFMGRSGGSDAYMMSNTFFDQTNYKYVASLAAARYTQSSGEHQWYTAASGTAGNTISFTQAMTLDASGNLIVGGTTAYGKTTVSGTLPFLRVVDTAGSSGVWGSYISGSSTDLAGFTYSSVTGENRIGGLQSYVFPTFYSGGSESARIDTSGNLLVARTSAAFLGGAAKFGVEQISSGAWGIGINANNNAMVFNHTSNTSSAVGSITVTTSATAFNTSSDYRLKNTIAPMTGALAKVALLKPVTYKWNFDGSSGEGFIAHELAEIIPDCVTGEKDAVDADGNPVYQGIDTSFLVATLTAAIQELKALVDTQASTITTLTDRITALETPTGTQA
jgi:hypothetical protein